jgi:hypothetical protein
MGDDVVRSVDGSQGYVVLSDGIAGDRQQLAGAYGHLFPPSFSSPTRATH